MPLTNRKIDELIVSGTWAIEPNYGFEQLQKYLLEVETGQTSYQESRAAANTYIIESATYKQVSMRDISSAPAGSIAIIPINGVMRLDDGWSSRGIQSVINDIRTINDTPNIAGIVLKMNTGGGEAQAGAALKLAIEESVKPVTVVTRFLGSAGVMAALGADKIFAEDKTVEIGSVGAMVQINRDVARYYRDNIDTIYAKQSTSKNREWRSYLIGDMGPITERVTKLNSFFVEDTRARLSGDQDTIDRVLSGEMLFADEALSVGLIDGIKSIDQTVAYMIEGATGEATGKNGNSLFNNISNMKTLKEFLFAVIPFLNTALGVQIDANAEADAVLDAVKSAGSMNDAVKAAVESATQKAIADMGDASAKLEEATKSLEAAQAQISALTTEKEKLATELAALKLKATQSGSGSEAPPDMRQFETAASFFDTLAPKGGAKY